MSRFPERIAGLTAVAALLAVLVDGLLYQRTHLLVAAALLPLLFTAAAIGLLAFVRLRLARQAAEEARDQALLKSPTAGGALFAETEESAAFTVARSRAQFEKWFVPAVPLLLAAAQVLWALRLHRSLPWDLVAGADHLLAATFLLAQAFVFFLLGRYLVALGRTREYRLARGPGHAVGAACLGALVAGIAAAAAGLTERPELEGWAARGLLVLAGLLAAENGLRFLAGLYSPRRAEALAAAHETAVGGLFIDPGSWARRLGSALDYQFGFAVSDSGFTRVLRNAIAPLLCCQLALLVVMSCFVFLGPEEEGWRERLGRPLPAPGGQLTSGMHLKWPWPLESVRRLPVRRIQSTAVGFTADPDQTRPPVILWTIPHYQQEENFLAPSRIGGQGDGGSVPVNLITLNVPVEYLITNFFAHAYGFADAGALVRQIAYRAVTREIAGRELPALLGPGRQEAAARIQADTQAECDRVGLGVRIVAVPLTGVHPPVPVADAYQSVVGALEQKEATILEAKAYAQGLQPVARARGDQARLEAESHRLRRVVLAQAEAHQYGERLKGFVQSPTVFRSRYYLDSLRTALAGARKFIVDTPPGRSVLYFNFEEKAFPDLFELAPAGEMPEEKP